MYLKSKSFAKKNKSGQLPWPSNRTIVSSDDEKTHLQWAQSMYGLYSNNKCFVGYGGTSSYSGTSFSLLRQYAKGLMSDQIYRDILDPKEKGEKVDPNDQEGFMNINWATVDIFSKFRDIMKSKMADMQYEVGTQAFDDASRADKGRLKAQLKFANDERTKRAIANANVNQNIPEEYKDIKDTKDLEMLDLLGGIQLKREIWLKDMIEATMFHSDYRVLKSMVDEDIIDLGVAAMVDRINSRTRLVEVDYVDPARLIIMNSKYPDHRDSPFRAYIESTTISKLRETSNFTEEELYELAKKHQSGASLEINWDSLNDSGSRDEFYKEHSFYPYDEMNIDIMHYWVKGNEIEKNLYGAHKNGTEVYRPVSSDYKLKSRQKKSGWNVNESVVQYIYEGKYVIGTDTVYDCRKEVGIVRKDVNGVMFLDFPLQVFASKDPSMVDRCMGAIDDINIAVMKKRNTIAKMPAMPSMYIDLAKVRDSIVIGGKTYSMLNLVDIGVKTGVFFYSSINELGEMTGSNQGKPIEYGGSTGIIEAMNILFQEIREAVSEIRDVTGINEVSDGTAQQGDMLKHVAVGKSQATNNSLRPLYELFFNLFSKQIANIAIKYQLLSMTGSLEANYIPAGQSTYRKVNAEDISKFDFNVVAIPLPSQEDKDLLMQSIVQYRTEGKVTEDMFFLLYNMIKQGDFKKAQLYTVIAVKRKEEADHQRAVEASKAQAQAQGEAQLAVKEKEQEMELQKLNAEKELETHKAKLKDEFAEKELARQIKLLNAKSGNAITEKVAVENNPSELQNV